MWATKIYPYSRQLLGKDSRTMRKLALFENDRQWQDVFNRLVALATNLFKWIGLPETCDAYFFEQILLWSGMACILYDEEKGAFFSLPCVQASSMNIYYENTYYRAVSLGYSKTFRAVTHYNKDVNLNLIDPTITERVGVVCYDNMQQYPLIETIMVYTDKIVDAMRAIDVAAKQLKIPALIETTEESKKSVQSAIDNIDTNVVAVMVKSKLSKALEDSRSVPTGASPQIVDALWKHLHNLWSDALTALGINNINMADKKERLITDEVNSNNDFVELNLKYRLDARKHFAENFEAAFGIIVTPEIRYEADTPQMINMMPKGGDERG